MQTPRVRSAALLALTAVLVLPSCHYKVLRYGRAAERATLQLRTLDNDSAEPGAELIFSDALRREVLQRGGLRLSNSDASDYALHGRVREVSVRATSQSSVVLALEYRLVLVLDIRVESAAGERVALPGTALTGSEVFLASADVHALRKNRREAIRRVSEVLAARIHDVLDRRLVQTAEASP